MSISKIILKEISSDTITVYHGTNNPEDSFKLNNEIFVSTDERHSKQYGNKIFKLDIQPQKIFNSVDVEDIKKLYNAGYALEDPYLYDQPESIEDLKYHGIEYDESKDEYPTAEDFVDSVSVFGNSWEAIENTRGVVDWIEHQGYDVIKLYEDGIENYFILDMSIIKNVTNI